MAKIDKEMAAYLDGMEFALRICKHVNENSAATNALDLELRYRRGDHPTELTLPRNIDRQSISAMARAFIEPELKVISTALAWTQKNVMKLTPSQTSKFLEAFNHQVDLYRHDDEAMKAAWYELDADWGLQESSKKFMEDCKE